MFHAHVAKVAAFRNGFRTMVPFEWAPLRIYKTLFMGLSVWKILTKKIQTNSRRSIHFGGEKC
jgi:hypothetical protein